MRTPKVFVLVCTTAILMMMTTTVLAQPPPPPSTLLNFQEPHDGADYDVGEEVHVKVSFEDGVENPLYRDDIQIGFSIQKGTPMPDLNEDLGSIAAKELFENGFKFTVLESYLIPTQLSLPFRVRTRFDGPNSGYVDSGAFQIERE